MFLRVFLGLFSITSLLAADPYFFFSPDMIASHLKNYNDDELIAIEKDLAMVRSVCFMNALPVTGRAPLYIATAGGPGTRKSTILERYIHAHPDLNQAVYLDPDARGLRFMAHTYYSQSLNYYEIASKKSYDDVLKAAYEKWRGASNYITLTLLEEALQNNYDILYGTTSTGPHMAQFLPQLKKAGYRIELLLCSCNFDVREEAIEYRNKDIRFYQSSPEDAISKGKYFSERMPLYFQYADKLSFYWSDDLFQPEHLAAVLDGSDFVIVDLDAYVRFVSQYEEERLAHVADGKDLPPFKELLTSRTGKEE